MLFPSKQKRILIIFVLLVSSIQNMLKSTKIPYLPKIIREYHKQKCVKGVVSEMTKGQDVPSSRYITAQVIDNL